MLKPTKDARYPAATSATRPGATLRSSIVVRQAMDKMEQATGFFEIDLVAHCGHTLKGEHAWTLTATDVYLGWTQNITIHNRAHSRVVAAMAEVTDRLPYPMVGLDCAGGGDFINYVLVRLVRRADDLHDPREGTHLPTITPRRSRRSGSTRTRPSRQGRRLGPARSAP